MRAVRDVRVLVDGLGFPEGPRWRGGRLFLSDVAHGRVISVDGDRVISELCEVPHEPSGLGWDRDGNLAVVSRHDRRLLGLVDGELTEWADLSAHAGGPLNDMVIDEHGRAYVGNAGFDLSAEEVLMPANLVRVDPDGTVTVVCDDVVFPNGVVITPDGATLILAETLACRLSAFDIAPDGSLSGRRDFAVFEPRPTGFSYASALASGAPLPSGIALDAEDHVWVSDPSATGVHRVAEGGEIVESVATGSLRTFAVALGGEDRRTLFICAGPPYMSVDHAMAAQGRILACRVDVPGAGRP